MPKLMQPDLVQLQGLAHSYLLEQPIHGRLPDMTRALTQGEATLVAMLQASIVWLNKNGAFKDGWLESLEIRLETPDSEPEAEDEGFDLLASKE